MTDNTNTNTTTTCARCGQPIARNSSGGWTNFDALEAGAGHHATLCDGIHLHRPATVAS